MNRLLAAASEEVRASLRASMREVDLDYRRVLHDRDEPIGEYWFPHDAVVSLTVTLADGRLVEGGTIGCEGFVGAYALCAAPIALGRSIVQHPGRATGIAQGAFRRAWLEHESLRGLVDAYNQAFLGQIVQSVACNASHAIEQRLARWLLMCHDRSAGPELDLTHEFLAQMIGASRPQVSIVAHDLQEAGLIHYKRGTIVIADRSGLERASCECYGAVRRVYERLLPKTYG